MFRISFVHKFVFLLGSITDILFFMMLLTFTAVSFLCSLVYAEVRVSEGQEKLDGNIKEILPA